MINTIVRFFKDRRIFWVIVLVCLIAIAVGLRAQGRDAFVMRVHVNHHQSIDLRGIEFYDLQSSKGSVLLSGDRDLDVIKFLQQHNGETIILGLDEIPNTK